ncbi:hypothetical protein BDW02DRAFT_510917 [Decorospora gaudefroyi]|uniref:Uncharacterized protein n=1 Tax=Decorospora gaudefroyi TaxID=184978 RepID=A0A6A5JZ55_9PLEO|nr:hypothetical protein BDW02DRAFT_510917 [Decorospora gaudefroyi]
MDVHVKVFLKPGRSWPFDYFISIELHENGATMNTSVGLSMKLEVGSSISPSSVHHDTMVVAMPSGSAADLAATVIIPPRLSYAVVRVCDVREKVGAPGWTTIETADAVLEVGNGEYMVKRKDFGSRIFIENVAVALSRHRSEIVHK